MNDLHWEVVPAENKPKDRRLEKMEAKFLPSLPATFYLLGTCGSGKSSILWTLLTKGYVYGKEKKSVFDEALIYLGTLDAKSSFEKLPIENKLILEEYEPVSFNEYQEDLKKHQMERLEKKKAPMNTLLVFDDFVGAGLMKKPRPNVAPPVEKLALTSRHELNTSIFFCSQVYRNSGFSAPSVRNNINVFIVSRMTHQELLKIAEELSEMYEPDEWIEHYERAMASEPYNFVVLDRRRPIQQDRWTIKFHSPFPPSRKFLKLQSLKDGRKKIDEEDNAVSSGEEGK
jgi:hypothetical protein